MKKQIVLISAVALVIAILSCQKTKDNNTPSRPAKKQNQYFTMTAATTPGQMHNYIVEQYDDQFGPITQGIVDNVSEMHTLIENCAQIAIDNGHMVSTVDIEQYADDEIDHMIEDGLFNIDGTYKSANQISDLTIAKVPNSAIRTAMQQVKSYTGNDLVGYANSTMSALTGLTSTEQEMVDGYLSVLGSSYELWSSKKNENSIMATVREIAIADANGYVYGLRWAWDHEYYLTLQIWADYYCVKASIAAAGR